MAFGICRKWFSASAVQSRKPGFGYAATPEDPLDVMHQTENVTLSQPPDLHLANHVHRFIARYGPQTPPRWIRTTGWRPCASSRIGDPAPEHCLTMAWVDIYIAG